jgi:hypothetical protein
MANNKKNPNDVATTAKEIKRKKRERNPITEDATEQALINLSRKAAKKKIIDGTAPAQLLVHFLRLGTHQYKEEIKKLRAENRLLRSKTSLIDSTKRSDEAMEEAIAALKKYRGDS